MLDLVFLCNNASASSWWSVLPSMNEVLEKRRELTCLLSAVSIMCGRWRCRMWHGCAPPAPSRRWTASTTTGFRFFADKGYITLGKGFAECGTWQSTHGKKLIGKALFAECILSGTQQRLCRVPRGHSAKKNDRHGTGPVDGHFAECQPCRHSANNF